MPTRYGTDGSPVFTNLGIWLLQRQGAVAHLGTPMAWDAHCHLISGCEVSGQAPDLSVPPNGMGGLGMERRHLSMLCLFLLRASLG